MMGIHLRLILSLHELFVECIICVSAPLQVKYTDLGESSPSLCSIFKISGKLLLRQMADRVLC